MALPIKFKNVVAVTTPVTFTPVAVTIPLVASRVIPVPTLTTLLNVATPPVIILSVDATPVSPVPSPKKLVALTTPTTFNFQQEMLN